MQSTCRSPALAGELSPFPPAVLQVAPGLRSPQETRLKFDSLFEIAPAGFDPVPFQPPRN
jgi:hypothetical protein